jgi:hypothetical protein
MIARSIAPVKVILGLVTLRAFFGACYAASRSSVLSMLISGSTTDILQKIVRDETVAQAGA